MGEIEIGKMHKSTENVQPQPECFDWVTYAFNKEGEEVSNNEKEEVKWCTCPLFLGSLCSVHSLVPVIS